LHLSLPHQRSETIDKEGLLELLVKKGLLKKISAGNGKQKLRINNNSQMTTNKPNKRGPKIQLRERFTKRST